MYKFDKNRQAELFPSKTRMPAKPLRNDMVNAVLPVFTGAGSKVSVSGLEIALSKK